MNYFVAWRRNTQFALQVTCTLPRTAISVQPYRFRSQMGRSTGKTALVLQTQFTNAHKCHFRIYGVDVNRVKRASGSSSRDSNISLQIQLTSRRTFRILIGPDDGIIGR